MQRIWVFQQGASGEYKIRGVETHGKDLRIARVISIDESLPPVIDDPEAYLPQTVEADLVLDFLRHPDLSLALAHLCLDQGIPVVASGKKFQVGGTFCPPT